ncbi:MAG: hypothetical protein D3923_17330, partial [Candidatus Electrothrix sp. AR3]|nr:hypothetical protein [Candidatus Electrothrix sp. AR3]
GPCNACCPGAEVNLPVLAQEIFGNKYDYSNLQGHIEHTYVAYPVNKEVRQAGASGGLITGLLIYLLEKGQIDGAVIVGADPERPYLAKGILATTPDEIRNGAQSKYCVTPSMEVLREIRRKEGKFAVVALPCQIHGLKKMAKVDPKLSEKIEVIFGLYCTCTMNPNGHLEAMQAVGIQQEEVARFDFRGGGWPGGMFVRKKNGSSVPLHPSETFGTVINTMFRLFGAKRCYVCIDGLAEYADLSFGDFWAFDYPDEFSNLERCTLVSQRSDKGKQILQDAIQDGVIISHQLPADRISKRILAMVRGKRSRAAVYFAKRRKKGLATPDYHISILAPTLQERKKVFSYLFFDFFRGKKGRTLLLLILFSPLTGLLHKLNRMRLRLFAQYHNN